MSICDTPDNANPIPIFPANAVAPPKKPVPVKPEAVNVAPPERMPTPIKAAPANILPKPLPAPTITGIKCISS